MSASFNTPEGRIALAVRRIILEVQNDFTFKDVIHASSEEIEKGIRKVVQKEILIAKAEAYTLALNTNPLKISAERNKVAEELLKLEMG